MRVYEVKMRGKCTTCEKTYDLTHELLDRARQEGCAISPCCHAVATITKVSAAPTKEERK